MRLPALGLFLVLACLDGTARLSGAAANPSSAPATVPATAGASTDEEYFPPDVTGDERSAEGASVTTSTSGTTDVRSN